MAARIVADYKTRGAILPGIGHNLHKPVDPRAPRLFEIAGENGLRGRYIALMEAIAAEAERVYKRPLPIQVETWLDRSVDSDIARRPGEWTDAEVYVALARPGYVAYRNTLKALRMEPVEIACGPESRYQLTAAHLAALDPPPAGVILASPANPTGTIIEADELAAIADVCRARGIRIVSDEIYHGLSYIGPCRSILEFEPTALVVNSFSKYFSMVAWRLGWLLAPRDLIASARAYVGNLFLTAPSLSQHAGLAAMDAGPKPERHTHLG